MAHKLEEPPQRKAPINTSTKGGDQTYKALTTNMKKLLLTKT